jgi:hypothetical protein
MYSAEHKFLNDLKTHADQTRAFLSNKMKPERERSVCRAFLRALGVSFADHELIAPTVEPADVSFRELQFQVRELLRGRKRGHDWRSKQAQYAEAQSVADLLQPYSPPIAISGKSLVPEVTAALSEKAIKYGAGCKALDALVYIDLEDIFLDADSRMPDTAELEHQGWRSVSLLFSPYAVVLLAGKNASVHLRYAVGATQKKWANIETLFDVSV